MALMAFPGDHLQFHPYVGIGFTFQTMGSATPRGPFATTDDLNFADETVQDAKAVDHTAVYGRGNNTGSRACPAFGQITVSPSDRNWILYNGRPANFSYEIGIRYNIGTSIEKWSGAVTPSEIPSSRSQRIRGITRPAPSR